VLFLAHYPLLPFAGVAAGCWVFIAHFIRADDYQIVVLAGVLLLTTRLMLARQTLITRENERLLLHGMVLAAEEQAREARFRSLVQNASDIVLVIDQRGGDPVRQPGRQAHHGYGPEEVVGHQLANWVHPNDRDIARSFLATCRDSPTVPGGWRGSARICCTTRTCKASS
jgi:PAS domain-containing protein